MQILNKCQDPDNPRGKVYAVPAGSLCVAAPSLSNNVCFGDYGGPLYVYEAGKNGKVIPNTQEVFCTLTASPNVRPAASCLGGHLNFCTFLPGPKIAGSKNVLAWILTFINPLQLM